MREVVKSRTGGGYMCSVCMEEMERQVAEKDEEGGTEGGSWDGGWRRKEGWT